MFYKELFYNYLEIRNINFGFCLSDSIEKDFEKYNKDDILNILAFAPISYEDKKKIFDLIIIEQTINISMIKNNLEESYKVFTQREISEKVFLSKYIKFLFDWVDIISKHLSQDLISSIKYINKKIVTNKEDFWFYFIKCFYDNQKYEETLYFIEFVKKDLIKKESAFYNNLILYEVISLRDKYTYLEDEEKRKKLCQSADKLKNFDYLRIITKLECFLLSDKIEIFSEDIKKFQNNILEWQISNILNVFEITIYSKDKISFEIINNILITRDIKSYIGNKEFLIYNFLLAIYDKNEKEISLYKNKLEKEDYDFNHYDWYLKNNFKQDII